MSDEAAAHHLLTVLEERDLAVSLDDVLLAFESDVTKDEAASWVDEYLDQNTLLSQEELDLYRQLSSNGRLQKLETENSKLFPHRDEDLAAAVASLQTSTAAIEDHIKVLESQKNALHDLQALNRPNLTVEHMRNDRRRREHQEKARLEISIEELSSSISSHLNTATHDTKAEHASLISYTTERLASDDRMLTALPKIASNIAASPPATDDAKAIDHWCEAIVSFRTAEVKARVDGTYLLNAASCPDSELPDETEEELRAEKAGLQEELETLYTEIAPLAEMVVEHELRKPIVSTRELAEEQRRQAQKAWLTYVLSTLQFMSTRLETINSHALDLSGFLEAVESINTVFSSQIAPPPVDTQAKSLKRQSVALKSLLSPPVKLRSGEPLQLPPVLRDILRHTNITTSRSETIEDIINAVKTADAERIEKLNRNYFTAGLSVSRLLGEVLEKADLEAQALRDAVYENTKYKSVSFTDQILDERLKELGAKLEKVEAGIFNAENDELSMGESKVATFVEKWSHP
ncbi:uncharacterized protein BDZ99DRAFT_449957 [Mytilinidion resinicola]|uniref:Uncharacterized protein n=1 Tax=Mytilinidion resinicola TaxID=574789 RepID=A0A6A6YBM6_9PEZI|nr:uncharacterized protein BDZ99DRAFT_449957 [Mytilinidion resinicola]KAF2805414.1 hypothetical protein BDZ99DRAFT_449957 [Mytilinidion resinicola]